MLRSSGLLTRPPLIECTIRDEAPFSIDGREVAARHLENAIGQAVHLIYLPNTENCTLGEREVDRLCEMIGRSFPSATVQSAEAVYEGNRRSILMARIRTDSTDAVVDLAQRLCIAFQQRFVGIEKVDRDGHAASIAAVPCPPRRFG